MRQCLLWFSLLSFISTAQSADWPQCKTQKLESMRLEKALRKGRKLKGYASRNAMKRERRRIDDWLWKHCRYYDSELRDLYAERM